MAARTHTSAPRGGARGSALAVAILAFAGPGAGSGRADEAAATRDVKSFCANIAVAASDARAAWQTARLNELEARIKARVAELDAKTAELRAAMAKRAEEERRAGERLVGIYSKMRPETAATQIAALDDEMAAAVLGQLAPRQASAIFNEFDAARAAKLAGLIAGGAPAGEKKL